MPNDSRIHATRELPGIQRCVLRVKSGAWVLDKDEDDS